MNNKEKIASVIRQGFIPILINDRFDSVFLTEAISKSGLKVMEYSLRRKDIAKDLPKIKKTSPQALVLAASIIDNEKIVKFLKRRDNIFYSIDELYEMGVDGIISMLPFKEKTYKKYSDKLLLIPGVETAAEALEQLTLGAHLIKFFNTEAFGGPSRIKLLHAPTHNILPIIVTGGIRPEVISAYIENQVLAVAAGFDLILGEKYQEMQDTPDKNFIAQKLERYLRAVKEARMRTGKSNLGELESESLLKITGRYFGDIVR